VRRVDGVVDPQSLEPPLLIKLDVQGAELQALQGMPGLVAHAAHVYAEVSFLELYEGQPRASEVIAWLAENGFSLVGVYNPSYSKDGSAVQADALFSRTGA
jgi:hypothetical protein